MNAMHFRNTGSLAHLNQRKAFLSQWKEKGLRSDRTIPELIERGVSTYPDTRLVFGSRDRPSVAKASDLYASAIRLASGLTSSCGIKENDVVVSQLPNWQENVTAFLACLYIGAVYVPVVHIYGAAELRFILRQSQARTLIVPDRWRKIDFAQRVLDMGEVPDLEHIIVVGEGKMPGRSIPWTDLFSGHNTPVQRHTGDPDNVCAMVFTSGTTADPKGVMHSHHTLAAEVITFPPARKIRPSVDSRFWATPGGHIGALVSMLCPFLLGENTIFIDLFEGELSVDLVRKNEVSCIGGVPYSIATMMDVAGSDALPGVELATVGGAGVPPSLIERGDLMGISLMRSYGSSEHPTITSCQATDSSLKRTTTDGRLLPGCMIRIVDDEDREVAPGEAGEIVSMGPELFVGYLNPVLNDDAFTSDGWFRTGDIGVMDSDGFLTIVDRKKDIIIRGGENIASREVENILMTHPLIVEAAAVSWPDKSLGEKVGAFVKLRPDARLDIADVQAHFAAAGVARQKTPEHLVLVEEFPRTPVGKILKTELRKRITEIVNAS